MFDEPTTNPNPTPTTDTPAEPAADPVVPGDTVPTGTWAPPAVGTTDTPAAPADKPAPVEEPKTDPTA